MNLNMIFTEVENKDLILKLLKRVKHLLDKPIEKQRKHWKSKFPI